MDVRTSSTTASLADLRGIALTPGRSSPEATLESAKLIRAQSTNRQSPLKIQRGAEGKPSRVIRLAHYAAERRAGDAGGRSGELRRIGDIEQLRLNAEPGRFADRKVLAEDEIHVVSSIGANPRRVCGKRRKRVGR